MNPRRSFFSRLGLAVAALSVTGATKLSAESPDAWQPARYPKDDWFEQIPGRHRLFFDTLTDAGLREARGFANNYFDGSKSGYGLEQSELAVVICLRHSATPFASATRSGPSTVRSSPSRSNSRIRSSPPTRTSSSSTP